MCVGRLGTMPQRDCFFARHLIAQRLCWAKSGPCRGTSYTTPRSPHARVTRQLRRLDAFRTAFARPSSAPGPDGRILQSGLENLSSLLTGNTLSNLNPTVLATPPTVDTFSAMFIAQTANAAEANALLESLGASVYSACLDGLNGDRRAATGADDLRIERPGTSRGDAASRPRRRATSPRTGRASGRGLDAASPRTRRGGRAVLRSDLDPRAGDQRRNGRARQREHGRRRGPRGPEGRRRRPRGREARRRIGERSEQHEDEEAARRHQGELGPFGGWLAPRKGRLESIRSRLWGRVAKGVDDTSSRSPGPASQRATRDGRGD